MSGYTMYYLFKSFDRVNLNALLNRIQNFAYMIRIDADGEPLDIYFIPEVIVESSGKKEAIEPLVHLHISIFENDTIVKSKLFIRAETLAYVYEKLGYNALKDFINAISRIIYNSEIDEKSMKLIIRDLLEYFVENNLISYDTVVGRNYVKYVFSVPE